MSVSKLVKTSDYELPNKKLIVPCQYGLRCNNLSNCQFWHNPRMRIIPLCQYGQKCTRINKGCRLSHDINSSKKNICPHGLQCYKNNCSGIHPIEANRMALGKCNLLYRTTECSINLNPDFFAIKIYDSMDVPFADLTQVFTMHHLLNVTIDRYHFECDHIYQVFSNKTLGGGTLGNGNVQEEKIMLTVSLLQYLMCGFHHNSACALSNNLELNPIVVDTMVVVRDNSYYGCTSNLDSIHYGREGLKIASNKKIASSLYTPINIPVPIKLLCVAVPAFINGSGLCYDIKILENVFQTLFRGFVATIIAGESDELLSTILLHIGNIGCGAFNHNLNTIFVLQYLAINMATNFVNPVKHINIIYHAYDDKSFNIINLYAKPVLVDYGTKNMPISDIIQDLRKKQIDEPDIWAKKL